MGQERLQATIPVSNEWHNEDIEEKAKELGMEKGEFILKSVDMMMHFDPVFYKRMQKYSQELMVPEWIIIQNMIIKRMAKEAAKVKALRWKPEVLMEFAIGGDDPESHRMLTGKELFDMLLNQFFSEEKTETLKMIENGITQYSIANKKEIEFIKNYDMDFYNNNIDKINSILQRIQEDK